jgi:ribosomal protein S27AE
VTRGHARRIVCPNCGRESEPIFQFPWATEFFCPYCHSLNMMTDRFLKLSNKRMITLVTSALFAILSVAFFFVALAGAGTSLADLSMILIAVFLILTYLFISAGIVTTIMLRYEDGWEVAWKKRRCLRCGTVVLYDHAHYCSTCGESLLQGDQLVCTQTARSVTSEQRGCPSGKQHSDECMVCNTEMKSFDVALQCPKCGSAFHAIHLVEYVHVHGRCPICGEHLDESDLIQHMRREVR